MTAFEPFETVPKYLAHNMIVFYKKISLFLLSGFVLFSSCSKMKTIDGFTQGTTYHIVFEQGSIIKPGTPISKYQIDSLLADFDLSLSSYHPNSIISRINRNEPSVLLDDYFIKVFNISFEVYKATDGIFDLTVAPLVNAWGFGPEESSGSDSLTIDSLMQFVGMNKVRISENYLVKDLDGIKLDVNAVAQGYSVDVVGSFIEEKGIKNYLVEIGGEVRARGRKLHGKSWRVGIDKPYENNFDPGEDLQEILIMDDMSLATSGNYRKFYVKDGVKYSHSIDPGTGYPVMDRLLSATIVSRECIYADAYATACMIMGLEESIKLVNSNEMLEAYFVYSGESGEFQIQFTDGFEKYIYRE